MKLRNKKTGQIGNFIINKDHFECVDLDYVPEYRNLAELNTEWEDYEEPKEFWYISDFGFIFNHVINDKSVKSTIEEMKSIGNYFETKEEAEQAVEKLKAWKRLKDKGFRFDKVSGCWIEFTLKSATSDEDFEQGQKDLHLLFGGEE